MGENMNLLDKLLEIVDAADAPTGSELSPGQLVDDCYQRLFDVIKAAESEAVRVANMPPIPRTFTNYIATEKILEQCGHEMDKAIAPVIEKIKSSGDIDAMKNFILLMPDFARRSMLIDILNNEMGYAAQMGWNSKGWLIK